ncbi:DUF3568 family protein [Verrucomicrobiota bacterium]
MSRRRTLSDGTALPVKAPRRLRALARFAKLIPILAAILTAGCMVIPRKSGTGDAVQVFLMGELGAELPHDPEVIAIATQRAFDALGVTKSAASASKLDAVISGRTPAKRRVRVRAWYIDKDKSRIKIRVGAMWVGNRYISRGLLDQIKLELEKRRKTSGIMDGIQTEKRTGK